MRSTAWVLLGMSLGQIGAQAQKPNFKAEILYPKEKGNLLYQGDKILVQYNSEISDNSLYTWCWDGKEKPTLKSRVQDAPPYNGEALVEIDFTASTGNCWFNLKSNEHPTYGGHNSGGFTVLKESRPTPSTFGLDTATSTATSSTASSTSSTSTATTTTESSSTTTAERTGEVTLDSLPKSTSVTSSTSTTKTGEPHPVKTTDSSAASDGGLSPGAKAGVGVGVAFGVIGLAALIFAFWFVRRRRDIIKSDGESDNQELYVGELPKRPWRTNATEMATKEEQRMGPHHELPG